VLRLVVVAVALVLACGVPEAGQPARGVHERPSPRRPWTRRIGIAFVVVVLTGPPSVDDLRVQAGLAGRRELLIGVKDDQPGVAEFVNGVWSGFDIEIVYLIAEGLGFRRGEIRFLAIESEDRARMQATDSTTTGRCRHGDRRLQHRARPRVDGRRDVPGTVSLHRIVHGHPAR
jgi:ABC-type amino acid transport substrate-binding protein